MRKWARGRRCRVGSFQGWGWRGQGIDRIIWGGAWVRNVLLSFGVLSFATCCALLLGLPVVSSLLAITRRFTLIKHLHQLRLLSHLLTLPWPALLTLTLLHELPLHFLAKLQSDSQPTISSAFHTPPLHYQHQGRYWWLLFQGLRWLISFGSLPKAEGFSHQYRK